MPKSASRRPIAGGNPKARTFGAILLLLAAASPSLLSAQTATTGLQPGDMVRLKIWREPDLSGEFQVDERGEVVFPKLGPMQVSLLSADSLKSMLIHSYTAYLRDPSIEVTLLRRVNVQGSVRTPGLYQVDQTQTVADVLAQAGGPTNDGKVDKIELIRGGTRVGINLARDTYLFQSGIHSGDQLWVPQKSWLSRNSGTLVAAGLTATAIIVATVIKP